MKQAYEDKNFRQATLDVIAKANSIIEEYTADGYSLTLRQLYYQFVARDLIPNKQSEYKRLGSIINDGRMAGLIDWDAIEDRTRNLTSPNVWGSPEEIVEAVARQYQEDLWATQRVYAEVWVEKEALAGVIERACQPRRVPFFSCRGYVSQSEQHAAGRRLLAQRRQAKRVVILHLGDHDPSGLDMTRDNRDRLRLFGDSRIEVRRLALNRDQIDQYDPPPNPAKDTDARFAAYAEEHGDESYELDALDPKVLNDLINANLEELIDAERWAEAEKQERINKGLLREVSDKWPEVCEALDELREGE